MCKLGGGGRAKCRKLKISNDCPLIYEATHPKLRKKKKSGETISKGLRVSMASVHEHKVRDKNLRDLRCGATRRAGDLEGQWQSVSACGCS